MRKAFRLSAPAKLDADELVLRIAEDDWQTALRIDDELESTFALLASRPHIGHTRTDLDIPPHLRVWPFYSWLIIYDPATKPLEIVRVWHGAQRKPKL
jgi:plasmid stabilization system protein ParE